MKGLIYLALVLAQSSHRYWVNVLESSQSTNIFVSMHCFEYAMIDDIILCCFDGFCPIKKCFN